MKNIKMSNNFLPPTKNTNKRIFEARFESNSNAIKSFKNMIDELKNCDNIPIDNFMTLETFLIYPKMTIMISKTMLIYPKITIIHINKLLIYNTK